MWLWGDLVDLTSMRVFLSGSVGRKLGRAAFFREVRMLRKLSIH
jgi:hypothetical protein